MFVFWKCISCCTSKINLSTSNARRDSKGFVYARLQPRYPILGQWKTDFDLSYDVPTRTVLKQDVNDPSLHILNVTMSPPVIRTFTEKLYVEIVKL